VEMKLSSIPATIPRTVTRMRPVSVDEVRKMREGGRGPAEIAAALGISQMSVWRALN